MQETQDKNDIIKKMILLTGYREFSVKTIKRYANMRVTLMYSPQTIYFFTSVRISAEHQHRYITDASYFL